MLCLRVFFFAVVSFYADANALASGQTGVRSWCKQQQQSRSSEGGASRVAGEELVRCCFRSYHPNIYLSPSRKGTKIWTKNRNICQFWIWRTEITIQTFFSLFRKYYFFFFSLILIRRCRMKYVAVMAIISSLDSASTVLSLQETTLFWQ